MYTQWTAFKKDGMARWLSRYVCVLPGLMGWLSRYMCVLPA